MKSIDIRLQYEYINLRVGEMIMEQITSAQNNKIKNANKLKKKRDRDKTCLLYTSPSPRDGLLSRMPSSA